MSGPEWVTAHASPRDGMEVFLHIVRAPDDPERRAKAKSLGGTGNNDDATPTHWSKLVKMPVETCVKQIEALLADGKPRTFNAICVELWDKTADILFDENHDHALWRLVAEGRVEHTTVTPIFFRRTSS